jgi:hydrogenase maturation protease
MIKVVGVGNPLLGDDGFGLEIIKELENKKIDYQGKVKILSLPTPSPWLLYEVFREGDYFIVVDALYDGEIGEIESFPISYLKSYPSHLKSLHEVSLAQVIDLLSLNEKDVDGIVVGTKIKDVSPRLGLSEELLEIIPKTVDKILEILEQRLK